MATNNCPYLALAIDMLRVNLLLIFLLVSLFAFGLVHLRRCKESQETITFALCLFTVGGLSQIIEFEDVTLIPLCRDTLQWACSNSSREEFVGWFLESLKSFQRDVLKQRTCATVCFLCFPCCQVKTWISTE